MAYWYNGKPCKEDYREFAAMNLLKNLVKRVNDSQGLDENAKIGLHFAAVMLETQGYKITFFENDELILSYGIHYIERMRVHILDTDEVLVVSFGIPCELFGY